MDDELERWIDEQEALPEHLKRWVIFERPGRIWLARILMHIGLFSFGRRLCGMRWETDEERVVRLRKHWRNQ